MHLSKLLIIIGCVAASIIAIARKMRVVRLREDLEKARMVQAAEPAIGQATPAVDLATLRPNQKVVFHDVDGYKWEIWTQASSTLKGGHQMRNLRVSSDNPQYLKHFRDPAHGDFANLDMMRQLREGKGFDLVDSDDNRYAFPAIKPDTLRRSAAAVT